MDPRWRTIPGFIRIGTTGKTRGITGEIKLYLEAEYLEDAFNAQFLFLELNGNKVPLEVESIREVQDFLVTFRDIEDPTEASKWTSLEVFLPSDEISIKKAEETSSKPGYSDLLGFSISDIHLGMIGHIHEVREYPQQEMAVIQFQNHEVLVPLNAVFITQIDHEKRTVFMDLPAGLLEV